MQTEERERRVIAGLPVDDLGTRLAAVRSVMGWNVSQAAQACGLSASSWKNWEAGKGCEHMESVCRKVANASGVSYDWLTAGGVMPRSTWSSVTECGQLPLAFDASALLVAV